jgi:predicted RNA-binding Zn-ribbon protein involved in translation (DUF1610 family)
MRSNQDNPIDLPDDPLPAKCVECDLHFTPEQASDNYYVCPGCGNCMEPDDE